MPSDNAEEALVDKLRAAGCVFAEEEARVLRSAAADAAELARMLAARVAGAPLELLVGYAEFCGLRIAVAPVVFEPRQRSAARALSAAERLRA